MTVLDGAPRLKPKSIVIQNTLNANLQEKSDGISIIITAALHDFVVDANGNLLASFRDARIVWIGSCIMAILVMPAEPLEAVSPNCNAWTIRVARFMAIFPIVCA